MKGILINTWAVLDKKEKNQFIVLTILDIIISIVDIFSLILLLWVIQFYIQPAGSTDLSFLPGWLADRNSIAFIALFFILFGAKNIAGFLISRIQYQFISQVAIRISRNNLMNYQQAGFEEFVNTDSSSHIRKIGFQPFEFCQYLLSGLQQVITQVFLITITIIAIVLFNARLFLLLLLILLPPAAVVFYFIRKHLAKAKKDIQASNENSFRYLLDALKGYVVGNIYNRNDFFMARFIRARQKFSMHLFDSISLQMMPNRVIEIFAILGLFMLIAIAKWSGSNDSMGMITIGAFLAAAYKIIPGIVKVININGQMKAYEFSADELVVKEKSLKTPLVKTAPEEIRSIELENISFQYPVQAVLDNFCLAVKKGDFTGITGESGKGKTTVLNLILGLLQPSKGNIRINDIPVTAGEIKKYWPLVSYVSQQSFFIHDTILRNITLQEEGYQLENLQYALQASGLNEFISKFPEGLNKIITENGKNISGGQQQRIAMARALYKKAPLILLDEPFNELDETSVISMLSYFRALSEEGNIVIMVTHDKKSLAYCTKIVSLDEQG